MSHAIPAIPEPAESRPGDTQALLRFLRENRLPREARLSAADIDAQIEAERNAWE